MRLQDLLIGLLMFSLFALVILGFTYSTYRKMDVTLDGNTSAVFATFEAQANKTNTDIFGQAISMQKNAPGGSEVSKTTDGTYAGSVLGSGIAVLNSIPIAFGTLQGVLRVIANAAGIDVMFINVFFASIVIIVVLLFVSSILQNQL